MNAARELWTMFSPHMVEPGHPGGGRPTLTPADLARALQGLARGPFLMGMAKETADFSILSELENCLTAEIKAMSWPSRDTRAPIYYRRCAGVAVFEVLVQRPNECAACNGEGYVMVDHQGMPCIACEQTGGHKLSARTRAEFVGLAWSSWRERWELRYENAYSVASAWHEEALDHLARNIPALLACASPC